jgi:hypothetical protein
MSLYQAGKRWFFPELGRHSEVGELIELPDDVAEDCMRNEPGLLAPARRTTQARATHSRTSKPRGRPKKA